MPALSVAVLGSNGWYDTEAGSTICLLIRTPEFNIVLDAGLGFSKLDRYGADRGPTYVFLSHYHLDHIYGLHILPRYKFPNGLTIFGQAGIEAVVRTILDEPFSVRPEALGIPLSFREIPREAAALPFEVECAFVRHAGPTLGVRFTIGGKVITYVPDTGYCPSAVELARGADLVFAECSGKPDEKEYDAWPHLNPQSAARIAQEAAAKELVLIHFAPTNYPTAPDREAAGEAARRIFPHVSVGSDGSEYML